jgi:protein O-mannosyl-transferase
MRQESSANEMPDIHGEVAAQQSAMDRLLKVLAIGAILAVVTIAAYWNVAGCQYVSFDDPDYVTENYHVKQGLTLEGVRWAFTESYASNWHPLTWLSHMLDVRMFGLENAAGPHLVNLALHIVNTLLLLLFLFYTTGRVWPSAFAAAVFALHPLHVESVAWISERKDVLSTFFWMLTLLAYAWYIRKPSRGRYAAALVLFALGLMAKPMVITLPVVLLLLDYWPLGRFERASRRTGPMPLSRLLMEKVPFALLSVASAVVTMLAQKHSINTSSIASFSMLFTNAVVSYGRYIWMMLYPVNLANYYPHPYRPLIVGSISVGLLLIGATVLVLRYRRQYPFLITGWFWYLITLVPVIGLVQVGGQSHADRYTYIPLTGIFVIIAWGAGRVIEFKPSFKGVFVAAAGIALAGSAAVTFNNIDYWHDGISLLSHDLKIAGEDGKLEAALGARLIEAGQKERGIAMLEKAATSKGHDGSAFNALGVIYLSQGDTQKAIKYFSEAAKYDFTNVKAERSLGVIYSGMKDYRQAAEHLRRAVTLDPYNGENYALLAIAISQLSDGDLAEAQAACDKAMQIVPEMSVTYYARGMLLARKHDFPGAVKAYLKSIEISPGYMAYGSLGNVLFAMGRLPDAAQSYRRAIMLEPDKPDAHYNLACMLERMGDKEGALKEARRVLEITPNDADAQAMCRRLGGMQ